jgi:non-ribosomal peptide synthetase component F
MTVEDVFLDLDIPAENSITAITDQQEDKIVVPVEAPEKNLIERPAVVLQTVGYARDPRGVRIAHTAIMNRISWTWTNLPYRKDGTCCLTTPITFVESINQIFAPLLKGITVHILTHHDVTNMSVFIKKIGALRVTRVSFSEHVLRSFLKECQKMGTNEARATLKQLKLVHCKGNIMPYDLAEMFFKLFDGDGKRLCCLYAHAEISGDVICEKFESMKQVKKRSIQGRILVGKSKGTFLVTYQLDGIVISTSKYSCVCLYR